MPLTGFANTAIDHVRTDRATVLKRLNDFARHDLVCYRAAEPQPQSALDRLAHHLAARDEFALTGLVAAAGNLKSVVLALSLADGRLDAAAAHEAAHIDETFQAETWGRDDEAMERRVNLKAELEACEAFIRLAKAAA